jgi:hypothetical protein
MAVIIQKIVSVPIDSVLTNKQIRTEFDRKFYLLDFRYNTRADIWMMNIYDENSAIIITGIALLLGVDLLSIYQDERLPPGPLFLMNLKNSTTEANRDNFGTDVLLFYGNTE